MSAASTRQYAYFRVVEAGTATKILVFDTQEISIGRSKESDLRSESAEMSRKHAVLCRTRQGCSVQNYSTSNATVVNGAPVKTHLLCDGDVLKIADLELTYFLRPENPAGLGEKLSYASELKGFAPRVVQGDGESTMLGMLDAGTGDSDFVIRPAGEFEPGMRGEEGVNRPRDLDLELEGFGLDNIELADDDLELEPVAAPPAAAAQPAAPPAPATAPVEPDLLEDDAWTLDDEPSQPQAAGNFSLHLELEGLTPELQVTLRGMLGKVIDLPKLRIRIKGDDLG
jgi:hypothetical protein